MKTIISVFILYLLAGHFEQDNDSQSFTYLALGDSYTIGESVKEYERYPCLLVDTLKKLDFSNDTSIIIAKTGWTTDELIEGIDERNIENRQFDFVTLLIGVNNQYRGRDTSDYRNEFSFLLNKAIQFAGNKPGNVIVLSIPDWGVTPFAKGRNAERIAKEINYYNDINREISIRNNVNYIDITGISRKALTAKSLLAKDGLHPSARMYNLWVNKMLPVTLDILKNNL